MSINDAVQALQELKQMEANGVKLPFRPVFILTQEARGHVVDLESGAIMLGGENARHAATGRGLEVQRGE